MRTGFVISIWREKEEWGSVLLLAEPLPPFSIHDELYRRAISTFGVARYPARWSLVISFTTIS